MRLKYPTFSQGFSTLRESLGLFGVISHNRAFAKSSLLVFLNKIDLLAEKLPRSPIHQYFPRYEGSAVLLHRQIPEEANHCRRAIDESVAYVLKVSPPFGSDRSRWAEKVLTLKGFKRFAGSQSFDDAMEFFQSEVLRKAKAEANIYTHHTCATDTNQVK